MIAAAPLLHSVPAVSAPAKADQSKWVFSLLPKSFQKNPQLDLTVISEMTDDGKKLPPVTPSQPAYYELFSAGFRALGEHVAHEAPFPEKSVTELLERSLKTSGYLPAKRPEHAPSLLIIFTWGTHNLLQEDDPENATLSPTAVARNLLDRAALVGGAKFAKELKRRFELANDMAVANLTPPADPTGSVPPVAAPFPAVQADIFNPVEQFKRENEKNEFLVDQAVSDVYYVVASAYDYKSAITDNKILLWRTRMTVAASGISQDQSMPTLITTAGPFFGKDMADAEIIVKRAVREGTVEVGTPTVVPTAATKSEAK